MSRLQTLNLLTKYLVHLWRPSRKNCEKQKTEGMLEIVLNSLYSVQNPLGISEVTRLETPDA